MTLKEFLDLAKIQYKPRELQRAGIFLIEDYRNRYGTNPQKVTVIEKTDPIEVCDYRESYLAVFAIVALENYRFAHMEKVRRLNAPKKRKRSRVKGYEKIEVK